MRQRTKQAPPSAEETVRDIRRATGVKVGRLANREFLAFWQNRAHLKAERPDAAHYSLIHEDTAFALRGVSTPTLKFCG